jgi:hypothetical protein
MTPSAPINPDARYSLDLSCGYLSVSRSTLLRRIEANEVRVIDDGRRRFISGRELLRLTQSPPR